MEIGEHLREATLEDEPGLSMRQVFFSPLFSTILEDFQAVSGIISFSANWIFILSSPSYLGKAFSLGFF